jgi:prevent-host-death family protein
MNTNVWQLQEAKSRFSELVEKAISSGPQFVTRRGERTVVILSVKEYEKWKTPSENLLAFFQRAPRLEKNSKLG